MIFCVLVAYVWPMYVAIYWPSGKLGQVGGELHDNYMTRTYFLTYVSKSSQITPSRSKRSKQGESRTRSWHVLWEQMQPVRQVGGWRNSRKTVLGCHPANRPGNSKVRRAFLKLWKTLECTQLHLIKVKSVFSYCFSHLLTMLSTGLSVVNEKLASLSFKSWLIHVRFSERFYVLVGLGPWPGGHWLLTWQEV